MENNAQYTNRWRQNAHIRRYLAFKKSILAAERDIAKQVVRKVLRNKPGTLRVLEIGPGDGLVTQTLLKEIARKNRVTSYAAIEYSSVLFRLLKAKRSSFQRYADHVSLIRRDANVGVPSKKYDLILLINSAYGINPPTFKVLLKRLAPQGTIAVLLGKKSGIIMEPTFVFAHEHPPTGESLRAQFKKRMVPFTYITVQTPLLKKSDFIRRGVMTKRAHIVMPYVIRGKAYDENAVTKYLKEKQNKDFGIPGELILIKGV